jgi:hypothetical protein
MRQARPRTVLIGLLACALAGPVPAQTAPDTMAGLQAQVTGQPAPKSPVLQAFGAFDATPGITPPERLLGFPLGEQAAAPEQIHAALQQWARESDRIVVQEYARSFQGRPLSVAIISSPDNLQRLESIRAELDELADPRSTSAARAAEIIQRAPAVAYIAHSIHGNETSGGDAALGLIYGLIASNDPANLQRLQDSIVIVDPLMNPDGRARALADLRGFRGASPSYDDQQLSRGTSWPYGRGNHYAFDLNRDWIFASQPETRGRLNFLQGWHPLVFVDAHEMGADDTFLFSPARAPINPHYAKRFTDFAQAFAREQAAAFDQRGWVYYSGEWNEGWYPGYSDAWGGLRGAVNILYEQARVADFGVRQANGAVMFYVDGVARQLTSAVANIESMRTRRTEMLQAFWDERRAAVAGSGAYANQLFAIDATRQPSREQAMLQALQLQGIEVHRLRQSWATTGSGYDGERERVELPAGTLLISTRQPLARLAATLMEFDPRIDADSLKKERESLLRGDEGTIYDITAWSLPMFHGLPAYHIEGALPAQAETAAPAASLPRPPGDSAVGWIIPGEDDGALAATAELLRAGLRPRVANRDIRFDGIDYPRGSVILARHDHPQWDSTRLLQALNNATSKLRQTPVALRSGEGEGDLPDLGGGEFGLLQPATVAVLGKGGVDPVNFGAVWFYFEQQLGIAPTLLDESALGRLDLRPYRVIVLPERWGSLPKEVADTLAPWVEAGGTLIAIGGSAAGLAKEEGLAAARTLPEALKDLKPYREQLAREWLAAEARNSLDADPYARGASRRPARAWSIDPEAELPDADALKERDAWQQTFMPVGSFVAARCDTQHWLSFGCRGSLPVLVDQNAPLMAAEGVEAPFRMGVVRGANKQAKQAEHWQDYGWGGLPPGQTLELRLAGLLWPEAAERIAHTAWVTRESKGRGQIILFATTPVFRGASHGMQRVLGNAVVYGPGMGTGTMIAQ